MTLAVTFPTKWQMTANGIETRYEPAFKEAKPLLEKYGVEWFL